jgi:hypothetical protein
MLRRGTFALLFPATVALLVRSSPARAQEAGVSIAVGVASPESGFTSTASTGYDIALQIRTDPIIGPLALRIDIGYDRFPGKGAISYTTQAAGPAVSLVGDVGSRFYWAAGPGYYQSQLKTQILGHNVTVQNSYLGAQAAVGVNFRIIRWDCYVEASAVRNLQRGINIAWVPIRFGVRL